MRSPGSVLIMVLGLLAVLAVVGITFVTMTNIDRRTAANFALQSQFMLAGDSAVDYVCHHLVQDLWYYDLSTQRYAYQAGGGGGGGGGQALLLTDQNNQQEQELARNEPFDYPSEEYDPWLSSPPQYTAGQGLSINPATGHFSYGEIGGTHYGLTSWGLPGTPANERPNNLGWPTRQGMRSEVLPYTKGHGHGVWNPDLAFPFDVGLIRISVTVLDHGGMINLNAHGRTEESLSGADGCPRYGYFISDVDPSHQPFRFNLDELLDGPAKVHGLWNSKAHPYNDHLYQAVIENPGLTEGDHPFTLDEEFELRRLTGTHFTSRLEDFAGSNLKCDPDTFSPKHARNRISLTTVSWTSEVRPDFEGPGGEMLEVETPLPSGTQGDAEWSPRKIDLNLDPVEYIKDAMTEGYVFEESDEDARKIRNQFVANISAFRNGSDSAADPIEACNGVGGRVGAAPQPLFSKIKVSLLDQKVDEDGNPLSTTWAIEVQIISPWRGNVYGDTAGLSANNVTLAVIPAAGHTGGTTWDPSFPQDVKMPPNAAQGQQWVHRLEVEVDGASTITAALNRIELRAAGMTLDRIDGPLLAEFSAADARHRQIARELEKRRPGDTEYIEVVYIGEWLDGDGGSMTSFSFASVPANGIPIRFPRCVKVSTDKEDTATRVLPAKGLPPYAPLAVGGAAGSSSFRAFTRVADLNQVLCPTVDDVANAKEGEDFFWPWVTRVAEKAALTGPGLLVAEEKLKFNWNDNEPTPGTYSRMNAANVFCVGGPWLDKIDNDGDGFTDDDGARPDKGTGPTQGDPTDKGRFGGPELRVAGKINLNTASEDTLTTLANSFDMREDLLKGYVETFRTQKRPIVTPAQIVKHVQDGDMPPGREEAKGAVERRDLPFTLISNIATVRSDTFSIYGTIEYGLINQGSNPPSSIKFEVRRRRRFWALVDRSPCLAYPPGPLGADDNFIRPRVLNFQWLD